MSERFSIGTRNNNIFGGIIQDLLLFEGSGIIKSSSTKIEKKTVFLPRLGLLSRP